MPFQLPPNQVHGFTISYKFIADAIKTEVFVSQSFNPKSIDPSDIPAHFQYIALWDTGATGTVINRKVVDESGLQPVGMAKVHGVGGVMYTNRYLVNIKLPNQVGVAELMVTEGTIHGADVLIGMDVMRLGDMSLSNHNGTTVFSFRMPSIGDIDLRHDQNSATMGGSVKKKQEPGRNDPCPCGSGRKYKKCCKNKNK